jgi:hypothetical protein
MRCNDSDPFCLLLLTTQKPTRTGHYWHRLTPRPEHRTPRSSSRPRLPEETDLPPMLSALAYRNGIADATQSGDVAGIEATM